MLQIFMLALGAYLVTQNQFTSGMMIAASILMSRALAPIEQSIGAWREFVKARDGYLRIKNYINRPILRQASFDQPVAHGEIKIEHVYFNFPGRDRCVLSNIHFSLSPGELLVIMGPSAVGKTTLARLLAGVLSPTQGHVRIEGVDAYSWDRRQFGQNVGYVAQNIELFDASVKTNIARMYEANDLAVVKAATLSGAHEIILKLPGGYEGSVGEQGRHLSGGQKQYIALARALYNDPKILILDEPTAFMDEKSQAAFSDTLFRIKKEGITIVLITHHRATIEAADKLLLLQEGKMAAFGPASQLLVKLDEI